MLHEINILELNNSVDIVLIDEKKCFRHYPQIKITGTHDSCQACWQEEGEEISKHVCNLESCIFLKQSHKQIKVDGTKTVYDLSSINSMNTYYETLHTCNVSKIVDLGLKDVI